MGQPQKHDPQREDARRRRSEQADESLREDMDRANPPTGFDIVDGELVEVPGRVGPPIGVR